MRPINNFIFLFITFISFSLNTGCSSSVSCGGDKDAFVNNFYDFIEDIKKKQEKGDLSEKDWVHYDTQFNKLTSECYQEFEKELTTTDQMNIVACTGFYLYSKHGLALITKLQEQEEAIQKILAEVSPDLLFKVAKEIINNPNEVRNILGDLEKRYGE